MAAASEQLDSPLIDDLEKKVNNFESQFKDKISQIEQKLSPVQKGDQQIAEIGEVDTSIGEVNTRLKKQDTDLVTKNQAVTYFNNSFVRKLFNVFTGEKTKLTQDVKTVTEDIKNTNNQLIKDINQKGNLEKMVTGNLDKNIAVCDQVKSEINVPKAKLSELSAEYDVVEDKTKGLRDVSKHRENNLKIKRHGAKG